MYLVTFNKHISYNIFLLMKKSPMPLEIYKKSHKLILSDRTGRKTLIKKKQRKKSTYVKLGQPFYFINILYL
jgi:hypothetical protein